MSKAVKKYFDEIIKTANTKLLELFGKRHDAESIRQYGWCDKLGYSFTIKADELDQDTTDNPATFTFRATKLTAAPKKGQQLSRKEIADHAKNVTNTLRKALNQNQKTLEDLQEKGFLFNHEKLDAAGVEWKSHQASWGVIEITFYTYD